MVLVEGWQSAPKEPQTVGLGHLGSNLNSLLFVSTRHACFQLLEDLRVYLENAKMHEKN